MVAGCNYIVETTQIGLLLVASAVSKAHNLLGEVGHGQDSAGGILGGDSGEEGAQSDLFTHSVGRISGDDVYDFVCQYACELCLCLEVFKHSFGDEDESSGQCEGVDGFILEGDELVFDIRFVADAGDVLTDLVYVGLYVGARDSASHLLFDFGGVLSADLDVLFFGNEHELLFAGNGIDCTTRTQAKDQRQY